MAFRRHTKDEGRAQVAALAATFDRNRRYYKSTQYLEANCRSEFIDKMLMALNWDVDNDAALAPRYREVILEVKTQVAGVAKHPDYALCAAGRPVVFVEAKPPSVKVLDAAEYALQLRKYAYAVSRPVSILTDFEEFAVYDTRKAPGDDDPADKKRVKYITYDHYEDEWDYLWGTFSYDAVMRGSIDTYFDKDDGNYERHDVDMEILGAVEEWRRMLVRSVKAKGGVLSEQNVNTAVQRLVNRFVYIWREKGY